MVTMSCEFTSPRELAGVVRKKYGVRLSPQEALLFFKLVKSTGLVTYPCIEKFLWADQAVPTTARKIIHVLVAALRIKVPALLAKCVTDKGYKVWLDWPCVTDIKTD